MPHPLRFESKKGRICEAWVWKGEGTEKLVNGKHQTEWKDCLKVFIWNTSINWCLYFRKVTLPFIFHPEFRKFSIKWQKPVVTQRVIAWSSELAFGPIRARIFCPQPMIEKLDFGPIRKKSAKYDDYAVYICSVVFNRHFECYVCSSLKFA